MAPTGSHKAHGGRQAEHRLETSKIHKIFAFFQNIDLIDPYLRYLLFILNTRRLIYCLLLIKVRRFDENTQHWIRLGVKYGFGGLVQLGLGLCAVKLYQQHTYILLLFLSYP